MKQFSFVYVILVGRKTFPLITNNLKGWNLSYHLHQYL